MLEKKFKGNKFVCGLCGSNKFEEIIKDFDVDLNFSAPSKTNEIGEVTSTYVVCLTCGSIQQYPKLSKQELEKYYSQALTFEDACLNRVHEGTFQFLLENTGLKEGTVLEIGCAEGRLLRKFKSNSFNVVGIEPSRKWCDELRSRFGIKMIESYLENLDLDKEGLVNYADLTICSNVLEHTLVPGQFMELLSKTVKPGGFLYIEVPSLEMSAHRELSTIGPQITPVHTHHFTGATLSQFAIGIGLCPFIIVPGDSGREVTRALFVKKSLPDFSKDFFIKSFKLQNKRIERAFNRLVDSISKYSKIAIWGIGSDFFKIVKRHPAVITRHNSILVDVNPAKQGKCVNGVNIISPDEIDSSNINVIVVAVATEQIKKHIVANAKAKFSHIPLIELF